MNKLLLVAIVALLGCQPWKPRPPNFRGLFAAVRPKVSVDVDAAALLAAQQQQPPAPAEQPPTGRTDDEPRRPPRDRTPDPTPTVQRTVAPPPTFVLRGETMGGKKICTKWTSLEECNADCTRQIRAASMAALSKDTGATKNCVCVEAKGC